MEKTRDSKQTFSTDHVMLNLWLVLAEDFSNTFGNDVVSRAKTRLLKGDIKDFRECGVIAPSDLMRPYLFKWTYQLNSLFKRYRFEEDVFTDEELDRMTKDKFYATQQRIARPLTVTSLTFKVLQRARRIVTKILGDYSEEEHMSLSRFGKRACLGTPYRESYLDEKLSHRPFTGSQQHIEWFSRCTEVDKILKYYWDLAVKEQRVLASTDLEYTLVPKSYKAKRGMMPDTLLGSFYTAGLGKVIESRLRTAGLDIRRLPKQHAILARKGSIKRRLATADLSSASDSLTLELIRRLLPVKWYRAVTCGRARYVKLEDSRILLSSFLTMGLGITFPLQTLIFYSIIKAIGELHGTRHYVSVFGDDLIYSSHLHRYVREIFPNLHLLLNEDKTYVESQFRESCGSDYYRGVDVRPFQPEGVYQRLDRLRFESFLYRIYNGLKMRWCEEDIPVTLAYIEQELLLVTSTTGGILQVPPSYPDHSGVKVDRPVNRIGWSKVLVGPQRIPKGSKISADLRGKADFNRILLFSYLHESCGNRGVGSSRQLPYLWDKLRKLATRNDYLSAWDDEADLPVLKWRKSQKNPKFVNSSITGKRFRRLVATVAKKGTARPSVKEASLSSWL